MFHPSILATYTAERELRQSLAVDAVFDACEWHNIDITQFVEFLCAIGHVDAFRVTHLA